MSVADETRIETRCCIVGGGPAGMMLGFLVARAGVDVVVLEVVAAIAAGSGADVAAEVGRRSEIQSGAQHRLLSP